MWPRYCYRSVMTWWLAQDVPRLSPKVSCCSPPWPWWGSAVTDDGWITVNSANVIKTWLTDTSAGVCLICFGCRFNFWTAASSSETNLISIIALCVRVHDLLFCFSFHCPDFCCLHTEKKEALANFSFTLKQLQWFNHVCGSSRRSLQMFWAPYRVREGSMKSFISLRTAFELLLRIIYYFCCQQFFFSTEGTWLKQTSQTLNWNNMWCLCQLATPCGCGSNETCSVLSKTMCESGPKEEIS